MEPKDIAYTVGITLTFVVSIVALVSTHRATRRKHFIDTVTAQRILWIEKLRDDIASFCGLTHSWSYLEDTEADDPRLRELDRLRYVIRLRLNRNDDPDKQIERLLKEIPDLAHPLSREKLKAKIEEAVIASQDLMKAEWEKVKEEAEKGRLEKRST